jgi:hypothetical protein
MESPNFAQHRCADKGRRGMACSLERGKLGLPSQYAEQRQAPLSLNHRQTEDQGKAGQEHTPVEKLIDVLAANRTQQSLPIGTDSSDAFRWSTGDLQPLAARLGVGFAMFLAGFKPHIECRPDPLGLPIGFQLVEPSSGFDHCLR